MMMSLIIGARDVLEDRLNVIRDTSDMRSMKDMSLTSVVSKSNALLFFASYIPAIVPTCLIILFAHPYVRNPLLTVYQLPFLPATHLTVPLYLYNTCSQVILYFTAVKRSLYHSITNMTSIIHHYVRISRMPG